MVTLLYCNFWWFALYCEILHESTTASDSTLEVSFQAKEPGYSQEDALWHVSTFLVCSLEIPILTLCLWRAYMVLYFSTWQPFPFMAHVERSQCTSWQASRFLACTSSSSPFRWVFAYKVTSVQLLMAGIEQLEKLPEPISDLFEQTPLARTHKVNKQKRGVF